MYLNNNNFEVDNKDWYENNFVHDGVRKRSVFGKWHFKSQQEKLEQNNLILLIMKHKWSRLHLFLYNCKKKKEVELVIRKKIFLNLCLCHHTPIEIIVKFVYICPSLVLSVDSLNMTPFRCSIIFFSMSKDCSVSNPDESKCSSCKGS